MQNRLSQEHFILSFLLLVIVASGADLIADFSEGVDLAHLIQEAVIMLFAGGVFLWIAGKLRKSRQDMCALKRELESIKTTQQSQEVLALKQQLSAVISHQCAQWHLTKSEKEVGLLLLKGFSLNEIAYLRKTAEKTVRQQASSIYKKANVAGRHAFSAWFIEDFL